MLTILLLACTSPPQPPATPTPPAKEEAPREEEPSAPWSTGVSEERREGAIAALRDVRTGKHDGYDRVVFELDRVPGWRVEYVDPVIQCGSGEQVAIAGAASLQIRLTPALAHDESGNATVKDRDRALDLGVARELKLVCDFEGEVTWALGVTARNPYRVFELPDPPRLVVDVQITE